MSLLRSESGNVLSFEALIQCFSMVAYPAMAGRSIEEPVAKPAFAAGILFIPLSAGRLRMKQILPIYVGTIIFILLIGVACNQGGNASPTLLLASTVASATQGSVLADSQDWVPPVFPGAISDREIQSNMTAVAVTPEALDETASSCFGFTVHNAVFYAYSSDADAQDVMDFYTEQMAAEGWKRIAIYPAESSLPRRAWQRGVGHPLVASVMLMPMEDGRTVIYLTVAETNSPQTIIEE